MPSWRTAASRHPTVILLHPPYYSTTAILSFANNRPMEAINRPISNSFRPPFRALRSPIVRPPCSLPFSSVSCVSRGERRGEASFYLGRYSAGSRSNVYGIPSVDRALSLSLFFLPPPFFFSFFFIRRTRRAVLALPRPRLASKPLLKPEEHSRMEYSSVSYCSVHSRWKTFHLQLVGRK